MLNVWVPASAALPVHAPLAVQEVASVEDHVRVVEPPLVKVVGVALKVTVGAEGVTAVTVMVTLWFVEPLVLVQVRV